MAINDITFKSFEDESLPTSLTDLYTAPASTTTSILSLILANKAATPIDVDVRVVRSGGTPSLYIVKDAPVPVGGALEVIENKPIVLETGDKIQARVSNGGATDADVTGSIMEMT